MGLGWGIRSCRTAEAIVTLHRRRLSQESSPLMRSLIEHALKLRWLAKRDEEHSPRSSLAIESINGSSRNRSRRDRGNSRPSTTRTSGCRKLVQCLDLTFRASI
jgi:hypothetical protein